MKWKPNWAVTKKHMVDFWNHKGLALWMRGPADKPIGSLAGPTDSPDQEFIWTNPARRLQTWESEGPKYFWGSDAFPFFETHIGPGSLGSFLGAKCNFAPDTVWYEPCIHDPENHPPLKFDPENHWFKVHMDLIQAGIKNANGRYLVALPDLIENIDTLAALRGTEEMLFDLLERPEWVHRSLAEINQAFFQAFDIMFNAVKDLPESDGGNVFGPFAVWGPGKTAKVQADFSAMISAPMFKEFVVPYLSEQCKWLDYSLYHLDGTTALQHMDALLSIESLRAIEWTPQAGIEGGGHARWFDIYRQIKKAGKCVQAIQVMPDEVVPLIDAVGPEGLYIIGNAPDQKTAERVMKDCEQFGWRP